MPKKSVSSKRAQELKSVIHAAVADDIEKQNKTIAEHVGKANQSKKIADSASNKTFADKLHVDDFENKANKLSVGSHLEGASNKNTLNTKTFDDELDKNLDKDFDAQDAKQIEDIEAKSQDAGLVKKQKTKPSKSKQVKLDNPMTIVFATSECAPFAKSGGLGDVAGSLPIKLSQVGHKVCVVMPKYDTIPAEYCAKMQFVCTFNVNMGWRNCASNLIKLEQNGVDYFFIENVNYFERGQLYGFFDDGERFAFFSKAVCEAIQYMNIKCDILHCNDWQTALVPVYLREFYMGMEDYKHIGTVFTIHNIEFQGQFSDKVLWEVCGLNGKPNAERQLYHGPKTINFMQAALLYADQITTVSPTYADEIKTPYFGHEMDGILRERAWCLTGILNGVDMDAYDSTKDTAIAATFSADDLSGKAVCKRALQEELGLNPDPTRPLIAMITRLTYQKGIDLLLYAADQILGRSAQIVVLGTGEQKYEDGLRALDSRWSNMRAIIDFDLALSKRIYAGADMFLMPSNFEPCGLSQIMSMRYGTLPIVRETGGLRDTVEPYNEFTGEGCGFSFANFNADEMASCTLRACELFWTNDAAFKKLQKNAMTRDFSWDGPVQQYLEVYKRIHP